MVKQMLAIWCNGRQLGDRIFNIFNDFDIDIEDTARTAAATPALQKRLNHLLVLIASCDRAGFKEVWLKSPPKTRTEFFYQLAGITGALRRLPDSQEFLYPEPSSGWLDLLQTLHLSQSPLYVAAVDRLQSLASIGQLRPDDLNLLENLRGSGLLSGKTVGKAAFLLEVEFPLRPQSSSPAGKHKQTGLCKSGKRRT